MVNKAGGYISKITFNNGKDVDINKNDIIIFVGPNNAGKSQSLKDIYALSAETAQTTVISNIKIEKYKSNLVSFLETLDTPKIGSDYKEYNVLGKNIRVRSYTEADFHKDAPYGNLREIFVANLDTAARLSICTPADNIARNAAKRHPIHYAAFIEKYGKWLSDNYKKAFDEHIIVNTLFGGKIPLCIGNTIKLDGIDDLQTAIYKGAETLDAYKQVQDQGDGIKSFTGILLYLMLDYYCTFLIDEPESFLHPPQANIMGRIIGETLSDDQQAFISTHSEDIIKGLLSVCPNRIKIIRITRENDVNNFSVLGNENFDDVWNDPLLKHSNIMSSLFHQHVVLCESDSDCKLYSIIESHIKQKSDKYSETLYIHCGGKHRMAKIAKALKMLNIDTKLIPDIDVLNDENVYRSIVEAFGIEWASIEGHYKTIVGNLHSVKENIKRSEATAVIEQVLSSSKNATLSKKEIETIKEALKTVSKWATLKEFGTNAIPRGDATVAFDSMNTILKEHGIYIVPVGELECFIKEVGGHGPDWVNTVLEKYPNLDDPVYKEISKFVQSINL